MGSLLKTIIKPTSNRYYTDKKTARLMKAYSYIPLLIIGIYGAIFVSKIFIIFILIIVLLGIISYIIIDPVIDKLAWKLFLRRLYDKDSSSTNPDHSIMKKFEMDPTHHTYRELQSRFKTKR